jgi:hypothetical protein
MNMVLDVRPVVNQPKWGNTMASLGHFPSRHLRPAADHTDRRRDANRVRAED